MSVLCSKGIPLSLPTKAICYIDILENTVWEKDSASAYKRPMENCFPSESLLEIGDSFIEEILFTLPFDVLFFSLICHFVFLDNKSKTHKNN